MELQKVEELGKRLLKEHGLNTLWNFGFNKHKRAFGRCYYNKRLIVVSSFHAPYQSEDEIKDTILHEIAHAICGASHGHDNYWKQTAISLGCSGNRCGNSSVHGAEYKGVCVNCKTIHGRYRYTTGLNHAWNCRKCGSDGKGSVIWFDKNKQILSKVFASDRSCGKQSLAMEVLNIHEGGQNE